MLHVLGLRKAALPSQLPRPMLGSRAHRAGPHQLVVLFGQQQNAAHIGLVVVERVELWGGHMEGPSLWEAIVQLLIEREQVHVVHGDVVCAVAALQEAHVDECCPIEPMQDKQGWVEEASLFSNLAQPWLHQTASSLSPPGTDLTVEHHPSACCSRVYARSCSKLHGRNIEKQIPVLKQVMPDTEMETGRAGGQLFS